MNYYTQFCFNIERLTSEEERWMHHEYNYRRRYHMLHDVPFFSLETRDRTGILFSMENGLEPAVQFVQDFLKLFRPTETICFEWAYAANAPVVEGFGGGAVCIQSSGVTHTTTTQFVNHLLHQVKATKRG